MKKLKQIINEINKPKLGAKKRKSPTVKKFVATSKDGKVKVTGDKSKITVEHSEDRFFKTFHVKDYEKLASFLSKNKVKFDDDQLTKIDKGLSGVTSNFMHFASDL